MLNISVSTVPVIKSKRMILQCFPLLTLVILDPEVKFYDCVKQRAKVQVFRDFNLIFLHENIYHLLLCFPNAEDRTIGLIENLLCILL